MISVYNSVIHESFFMCKLNDQILESVSTTATSIETLVQAAARQTNATTKEAKGYHPDGSSKG